MNGLENTARLFGELGVVGLCPCCKCESLFNFVGVEQRSVVFGLAFNARVVSVKIQSLYLIESSKELL